MRKFFRISGLVLFIVLLVLVVPNNISRLSAGANLRMEAPVKSSAIRTAPNVDNFVAANPPSAATPQPTPVLDSDIPVAPKQALVEPEPVASGYVPAPAPTRAPVFVLPAENHALEVREVRRALSTRTPTAPVDPHDTPQCLAPEPLDVFIHLPPGAAQHQPLRVLLVLHGMGGRGDNFSAELVAAADRNNWIVVAPTLPYKNGAYMDPAQLMQEDLQLTRSVHSLLDNLPKRLGLKLRQHVLIYGFSRGAQLGHRLAFFFPEHVESVAVFAAGSYTLPLAKDTGAGTRIMSFPYGLSDVNRLLGSPEDWDHLKTVSFWIGVGAKDTRVADVARAFDPYGGQNRVERARNFYKALQDAGVDARITVFPNADHEITAEMRSAALDFLRQDEVADHWND